MEVLRSFVIRLYRMEEADLAGVVEVFEAMETAGDARGAIDLYLRGIDADPVVEAFYQGVMRCYAVLGRHTEAMSTYRRMRQTLSVVLGVLPSAQSRALFDEIKACCGAAHEDESVSSIVRIDMTAWPVAREGEFGADARLTGRVG